MSVDNKLVGQALAFSLFLAACSQLNQPNADNSPGLTNNPSPEPSPTPSLAPIIPTLNSESPTPIISTPTQSGNIPDNLKSDFPSLINDLGDESSGVNFVTVDRFKSYFLQRSLQVEAESYMVTQRQDRMFGQLSLPIKDILDRSLNFDWRNNGQGLGFEVSDLSTLRTMDQVREILSQSNNRNGQIISRIGEDGHSRALTLVDARDFEKAVLAYVDEHLRINGVVDPANNPSAQGQRRALFERIVYGDLGVIEQDTDGAWQTVNDRFNVCETYTADANTRSEQPENTRNVEFDPEKEIEGNQKEEETIIGHDSDNTVLVIMVTTPDGSYLRVEVFDQSNPPDPLNPDLDPQLAEMYPSRAYGGRWLPCGSGVPTVTKNTPPPLSYPTPVPTNPHRDDPEPEKKDTPDRVPPTQIP